MNVKKMHAVRAVCFLIVLVLLISVLGTVFTPKNVLGTYADEPNYSLDYIAIGDSECYTGLYPMELWRNYGYAGYNCGLSAMRIQDAYYQLVRVLKVQSPKVLLLESNMVFRHQGFSLETQMIFDHIVGRYVPMYRYHNQWRRVLTPDLVPANKVREGFLFKGSLFSTNISPYTGGDYFTSTTKVEKIGASQKMYLDKIIDLCAEKDIKVILFSVPSPLTCTMAKHNAVAAYAADRGLTFLDLNMIVSDLGIDWTNDTYDKGDHLNFAGAVKVTAYIGKYLSDSKLLPDRRGDSAYSAWDDRLKTYMSLTGITAA